MDNSAISSFDGIQIKDGSLDLYNLSSYIASLPEMHFFGSIFGQKNIGIQKHFGV